MPRTQRASGAASPHEVMMAGIPLLDQLHRNPLAQSGVGAKSMRLRKGRDIIVAGVHYDAIYVNHDGWLYRYKILHDGSRQIVDFILPGQIFGLQACLFKRSLYSIAAITDASLSIIPFAMIDDVFERNPIFSKALFWSALCESAILGERLTDTARRSAYQRVGHLLLELFVRLNGLELTEGMSFFMPLTQEMIGDALGLTTVHVNRTFRLLRDDGLVAVAGKSITILDLDALSVLCDFENSYLGESTRALRGTTPACKDARPQRKKAATPAPA